VDQPSVRTATEHAVLAIWSSVLEREGIGAWDDFLALGGDSLAAMRCVDRIRAVFGVEVPIEAFFDEPAHVVEVAARIDQLRRTG
jgi:acyl carrier protein